MPQFIVVGREKPQQREMGHQGAERCWKLGGGMRLCQKEISGQALSEFHVPTFSAAVCVIRKAIKGFQVTCNRSIFFSEESKAEVIFPKF